MSTAWRILLALTFARLTMGLQFQSVPALAPAYTSIGLSYVALGTLMGAYLLPGVVVALTGGALSRRLGDSRVVLGGLALMCVGGLAGCLFTSFEMLLLTRLVAGAGAVCVNVLVTKMTADWFADRSDLPAAMGVLVSSWPAGIAVAALGLPVLAGSAGFAVAQLVPPVVCFAAFCTLLFVWHAPPLPTAGPATLAGTGFTPREWVRVILAGGIWGIYNVAFVGIIAWMPGYLSASGEPVQAAAALASLIGWVAIFSVALGGWAAAHLKKPDRVALGCFAASAVLLVCLASVGPALQHPWFMMVLGFAMGPAAAMIMTLPVEATRPFVRAAAMGIYFAIYYAAMAVGPPILGGLRDVTGDASTPLLASAGLMVLCVGLWAIFRLTAVKAGAQGRV